MTNKINCDSKFFDCAGGDTERVESTDDEGAVFKESIDIMSLLSAKVVLVVAFRTTSFDCLSVRDYLQPLAKYLEVKVRGIGQYQMAIPLAKELMKQQFVVPRDGVVMIN